MSFLDRAVVQRHHNNRDGAGRTSRRLETSLRTPGENHVNVLSDEIGSDCGDIPGAPRRLIVDGQILSIDPAKIAEPLLEGVKERRGARIDPGGNDADPVHVPYLLRPSGERRGEEAASKRADEGSAIHLLDHLIRPLQERRRDRQAEGLGGLEIDDEFILGRLLDRKVGGLRALEDPVHVSGGAAKEIRIIRAISHQPASLCKLFRSRNSWKPMTNRELRDPPSVLVEHEVYDQTTYRRLRHRREHAVKVVCVSHY